MTILGTLSSALSVADRGLSQLLGQQQQRPGVFPLPASQPMELRSAEGQRVFVTFADTVATYPYVYAVWSKIVRALATTEIGVYRSPGEGKKLIPVYDTEPERLLREPLPGKGLVDTLQWLFNPYVVEGNGTVGLYYPNGQRTPDALPINLVPLDWRYLSAWAAPGGPIEWWVSHQLGEAAVLAPEDVLHLAFAAPDGSPVGVSALQSLGTTIDLRQGSDLYQLASFNNGSRPAGALVYPRDADTTPEERAEDRAEVEKLHKGVTNAFRLAVLSGGMDWRPMSFSAVEADLDGTRRRTDDEVCVAFDVRKSVIAETDAGGKSIQERQRDFARTLIPHVRLAENMLQRQLIDRHPAWRAERYRIRFDLAELQRGTYREEMETAYLGRTNGVFSEDEARAHVGLESSGNPGADKPMVPHAQLDPGNRDGRQLPRSDETEHGQGSRTTT